MKLTVSFSLELIANNNFKNFLILNRMGKRNSIKMIPVSPRNQSVSNARLLLLKRQRRLRHTSASFSFSASPPLPAVISPRRVSSHRLEFSGTRRERISKAGRHPGSDLASPTDVKRRRRAPLVRGVFFPIKTDDSVC